MRAGLRGIARRLVLTLAGEATQSAFHFGVNVALVRVSSAEDYGVFAIVMVVGAICLTYMRALVGMPLMLLVSERRGSRAARAIEVAFGSAALLLAAGIAAFAVLLFDLWLHSAALSAGLFVGLWCLRGYLRTVLLAERRQTEAMLSDLSLAVTGGVLAVLLVRPGRADLLDTAFLLLAGANLAGIATALVRLAPPLRVTFRRSVRARFRALARQLAWSAASNTTANAQATGQVLLVATLGGPQVYAPMAAMLALFAPIRLFTAGLSNMLQPEMATRITEGRPAATHRILALWTGCAFAIGILYGGVAAAALPLLGSTVFAGQSKLLIFMLAWGTTTTFFLSLVPRLLLEVLRQFHVATLITTVSAVLGMAVVVAILAAGQPAWALLGNLLAEVVVLVWSWIAVAGTHRLSPGLRPSGWPLRTAPGGAPTIPRPWMTAPAMLARDSGDARVPDLPPASIMSSIKRAFSFSSYEAG